LGWKFAWFLDQFAKSVIDAVLNFLRLILGLNFSWLGIMRVCTLLGGGLSTRGMIRAFMNSPSRSKFSSLAS
jgi:hypothetical protein